MHISFARKRKTFVGIVPLVDLFWFTLRKEVLVSVIEEGSVSKDSKDDFVNK